MFAEMAARTVASPASSSVLNVTAETLSPGHLEPHLVVRAGRRRAQIVDLDEHRPRPLVGTSRSRRWRRRRPARRARASSARRTASRGRRPRSRARPRRQRPSRRRRPTAGPGEPRHPRHARPRGHATTVRRSPPPSAASRATSISPGGTGVGAGAERRSCSTRSMSSWALIASPPALPARPQAVRARCGCASSRFPEAGSGARRSRVWDSPE